MVQHKAPVAEIQPVIRELTKFAAPFGREVEMDIDLQLAQILSQSEGTAALGLEHARKAAKAVREQDSAAVSSAIFHTLAVVLKKAGKADEAKAAEASAARLADRVNVEALELAQGALAGLPKDAPLEQRVLVLRQLQFTLRQVGKAGEAKKVEQEANRAELKLAQQHVASLNEKTTPEAREEALRMLARLLRKNGKADEARTVDADAGRIAAELDREFAKQAVPFEVTPFAGRKGKSERVAVVELFTGTQSPPSLAADIAFDAALKAYKPSDAVLLQYHVHIPGPDPLSNSDTVARAAYYGDIEGTPATFVDGKATEVLGGAPQHGKDRFEKLSKRINTALAVDADATVKLTVTRKGDKISMEAKVSGLRKVEKARLRFVLIEDVAAYRGANGRRLHRHVVRAMPGGAAGFALKEASSTQAASIEVGELRKSLRDYLVKFNQEHEFPSDVWPMALRGLKVVALVQDDDTKQILQAAQADVPAAE
jgi:hypothetical protein